MKDWAIVRSLLRVAAAAALLVACGGEAPPPPKAPTTTTHPAPAPREKVRHGGGGAFHTTGMSYEEALNVPEDLDAVKREPELSNTELSAPLRSAAFIGECGAPDSMKVTVKVAVVDGRAMGVSVAVSPDDPEIAQCIDKAVRALSWRVSKKRFSLTTVY